MPELIKIDQIKRKGRNFLLISKEGEKILLTARAINNHGLNEINEIEKTTLDKIKFKSDIERAENYATYLLARRSYSIGAMGAKLMEKGYSKNVSEQIIRTLILKGHLDDEKFAREMTESILRNKPAGRRYIIARLRQKRIARATAEAVVNELLADIDETELAEKLLRIRWRYFSKFDLETARMKAYNYLSRRSINYRAAKDAFEKMVKEEGNN
jgi:SOS response regulatory protein OraA/RecX